MSSYKAYVLVPDDVPLGFAMNGVAHAGCCLALKWRDDDEFLDWARNSFRKVTCKVGRKDLVPLDEALLTHGGYVWSGEHWSRGEIEWLAARRIIVTESDWDDGGIVAVVYKPRTDWPKAFRKLELYK